MSSNPSASNARSIASQLVLLFTLASAFLLCCGLGVLYWIVVRHAFEEDNEVLMDRVFAVRADLENSGGPSILEEELKIQHTEQRVGYWVRVLDSLGKTAAETPGMETLLPSARFAAPQNAFAEAPRSYRTDGKPFALISVIQEAGGQRYVVQVAQDRSPDDEFSRRFRALLAVVLACGILGSAAIAVSVTRRGLRPLAEMAASFQRVGPTHLDERVPPCAWPRELRPLAHAFDDMMDRLEESFTRLSKFSADLAHELRTPIANLRGEAEVALTRPRSLEDYREVIESSVTECQRLSGMIDSLLFLARAEAADGQVERTLFGGRAAVEKIAAYYETVAEERRVAITCTGECEIYADAMLFGRAVSNLVDNALRHTSDGGRIEITIAQRDGAAEVAVADNGSGIAAEHLPRIFDRFYRADTSRSSEGTGLGLSLVKSITDLHGGRARVESEVQQGTTVRLSFPRDGATNRRG